MSTDDASAARPAHLAALRQPPLHQPTTPTSPHPPTVRTDANRTRAPAPRQRITVAPCSTPGCRIVVQNPACEMTGQHPDAGRSGWAPGMFREYNRMTRQQRKRHMGDLIFMRGALHGTAHCFGACAFEASYMPHLRPIYDLPEGFLCPKHDHEATYMTTPFQ